MSKVPKQATKVFSGVIFDVYQWPQKLFDGSTATFEMLKRPDTAIVVGVTPDKQVVVIDDEQPQRSVVLTFPGGRVDPGETPLEAAKRELMEETGYSGAEWELWFTHDSSEKIESTVYYYVARNIRKTAEPAPDGGERISAHLVSIERMIADIVSGNHYAYSLGEHIMQKIAQGKRAEIEKFLTLGKNR